MKAGGKVVVLIGAIVMLTLTLVGCNGKNNTKGIDYTIISKNDLSTGGAVRISVDAVVKDQVGKEELESISKEIVSEVKKDKVLNAVSINFYDYEDYIGNGGYTLGQTIYAPNGRWEDASSTSAGNYRYMAYNFKFRTKNWANRLTEEEVNIFGNWKNLLNDGIEEKEATKQISKKFNTTDDEVDSIITKQMLWVMEDN